jgi:flavin reductase (DIM6/NTAB) family NADH-FMN oxidoreductase RutF
MLAQLEKGAFLTTQKEGKVNTMTIGWGSVGYIWNKPMFTALVRFSRYTHQMLKNNDELTVSVPLNGQLKEALAFCGTQSGVDMDKIQAAGLSLKDSIDLNTPVIEGCDLHIECRVVLRQTMEPENLAKDINDEKYPGYDYHTIYYGEIINMYID